MLHRPTRLASLLAVVLAVPAVAQSPLCTINPFAGNNQNSVGGTVYFDLTVNVQVSITALDVNYTAVAGTAVGVNMYTTPGTSVGNETNAGAWTLVGTDNGAATAAGLEQITAITLASPVILAPGTYGIALSATGSGHRYTNGTGANQNFSTAELSIALGGSTNVPFTAPVFSPRVWNGCIHYTPGADFAYHAPYGSGCGDGDPASFYELFDSSNLNDLSGSGVTMSWTGSSFLVTQGSGTIVQPTGTPLALTDDSTIQVALPWAFPTPGGTTNDVWVCSNGWVSFETTTNADFSESVAEFLNGENRCAVYWDDFNPSAGGAVHAEVDPNNANLFHITWLGVPEFGQSTTNDFQLTLQNLGGMTIAWGSMAAVDGLAGYSPGNGAADPGSTDITAITSLVLGDERPALALSSVTRPVIGTTCTTQVSNIPTGALGGASLYGFQQANQGNGIDLTVIGMPSCFLYVLGEFSQSYGTTGSTAQNSLPIPAITSLNGLSMYEQSAVVIPMVNPTNVATTNGLEWVFGLN